MFLPFSVLSLGLHPTIQGMQILSSYRRQVTTGMLTAAVGVLGIYSYKNIMQKYQECQILTRVLTENITQLRNHQATLETIVQRYAYFPNLAFNQGMFMSDRATLRQIKEDAAQKRNSHLQYSHIILYARYMTEPFDIATEQFINNVTMLEHLIKILQIVYNRRELQHR